jgi:hypothetical protein
MPETKYLAQQSQGVNNSFFNQVGQLFGAGQNSPAGSTDLGQLILVIIQLGLLVAASVAVIFLMLGAYRYVVSRGNEEETENAKKTMTHAIFGLIVIVLAYAIVRIITEILLGGTGGTGI